VAHSLRALDALARETLHCVVCDIAVPANLDEMVEVAFNVVADGRHGELDPYASEDDYRAAFISENYRPGAAINEVMEQNIQQFVILGPGEHHAFEMQTRAGLHHRAICIDRCAVRTFEPIERTEARFRQTWRLTPAGFDAPADLPLGHAAIELINDTDERAGIIVSQFDRPTMVSLFGKGEFRRFLTANQLLCQQTYRDLFRFHGNMADLNLNVRSLTVLFTDLKGSTSMYEEIGDVEAYRLVHQHFGALRAAVSGFNGAVVKTMGDAIMATFTDPLDGMQAASAMVEGIRGLGGNRGRGLGLKVGLHEGPALVIQADGRLDYFGQTINTAARIQGQADADEICLSAPVLGAPGIAEWLAERQLEQRAEDVALTGVGAPVTIHRIRVPESAA